MSNQSLTANIEQTLAIYQQLCAQLDRAAVEKMYELVTPDIHFRDPFNDLHGREPFIESMRGMVGKSREVRIRVNRYMIDGNRAFLHWSFYVDARWLGQMEIEGVSELVFNEAGLICDHVDYWDSVPFYQKIPLIGPVISWLRRKFAH